MVLISYLFVTIQWRVETDRRPMFFYFTTAFFFCFSRFFLWVKPIKMKLAVAAAAAAIEIFSLLILLILHGWIYNYIIIIAIIFQFLSFFLLDVVDENVWIEKFIIFFSLLIVGYLIKRFYSLNYKLILV